MTATTYIIYHQVKPGVDCPDGIMAAAIASLKYPDAIIIGDSYNSGGPDFFDPLEDGDSVIIVDFSYPAERLNLWEQWGVNVTVIDHHAPKFPELSGFSGSILDADECGATLTWKHFFPGQPMPLVLPHVRRRDIGADDYYKAPGNCLESKEITAALSHQRHHADNPVAYLKEVIEYSKDDIESLRLVGEKLQKEAQEAANAIAQNATPDMLPDSASTKCFSVEIKEGDEKYVSLVGAAICNASEGPRVAWLKLPEGMNSLRSKGVDVAVIAKELGGGGHPFAAGFPPLVN